MNILITGGIGFIGTNAAIYFASNKKNKVTLVDNFSRVGVINNAKYLQQNFNNIEIIKSNVLNINKYLAHIKKADVVIHLAGQTAVTHSITNPTVDFQSNLQGGFLILETIRKHNPSAIVIFSSTNKVYGDLHFHRLKLDKKHLSYIDLCHPQGIDENEKLDFISPYGCSKGALDLYFLDYHRIFNLNTVVFRQSCIYGQFQLGVEDQGWVAHFVKSYLLKNPLTIFGDGYQVRDLLYVDDLVKAYSLAIKQINQVKGQAINIGGGVNNRYSLLQVIDALNNSFGYKINIGFDKLRLGDQKYFVSSNKKAKRLLNWQPSTSFNIGLKSLINWQKKNIKIL